MSFRTFKSLFMVFLKRQVYGFLFEAAETAVHMIEADNPGMPGREKRAKAKDLIKSRLKSAGHEAQNFLINLAVETAVAKLMAGYVADSGGEDGQEDEE